MKRYNTLSSISKKNFMLRINLVAIILLISTTSYAGVIFSENFDNWPTGWYCGQTSPNPAMLSWLYENLAATCNGDPRPFQTGLGVTANGRAGKGMQMPRSSCNANGYMGDMKIDLYRQFGGPYKELYFRWTMKFEDGFDKKIPAGFKMMDRILIRTIGGTGNALYPSLHGNKVSDSPMAIYGGDGHFSSEWVTIANNNTFYPDNAWHSVELRIKLNSNGASDGALECWIDGIKTYTATSISIMSGDYYFDMFKFGLGNASDEPWDQATFKSMYYDDLVISTTYIGPVSGSVDTPPVFTSPADTTPPVISGASPSGSLTYGTTSTSMSVTTNESATCKYGTSDVAYSSLPNTFSTTGSTSHSQLLGSLTNGGSYSYYVRCIDGSANANTSSTALSFSVSNTPPTAANLLFSEAFDDTNFASRNWYDGGTTGLASTGCYSGSCAQFSFASGATKPSTPYLGAMRKIITASDAIFVDYYIKYPTGWQEQSGNYGHHEILIASDADTPYTSLAFAHTMAYIEHWGTSGSSTPLTPHMSLQDGANIDQTKLNVDLTAVTENRSANGCNGLLDAAFFTKINCYNSGSGTYWNGKIKSAPTASMSLNEWHHVQAYFKMNSIVNNKGVADGTMAYWLDGVQQFRSDAVLFRTNAHATMKFNQFIIAPYMGNGSPIAQSFYIDNLTVWNEIPLSSGIKPVSGLKVVSVTP